MGAEFVTLCIFLGAYLCIGKDYNIHGGVIIMKKNKGFSMVELMIAIAIIAILAGAIAPTLVKYVKRARRVKDVQFAKEIQEAVDRAIIETEAGTSVSSFNWQYTSAVAWNKDSKVSDDPENVLQYAFKELGRMPECNTNRDWFWIVQFDPDDGKVSKVLLAPSIMGKEKYELWPNSEDFLEMKKK